jgi:hypothetical protein
MIQDKEKISFYDWVIHPDVLVTITKSPQEKAEDAKLRRFKERWLFITTLFVVMGMFVVCGAFVFLTFNDNSEYTGIALNGVIAIALALAGYYVRGKSS